MKALMADNDVGGPLLTILEIWESLSLLVVTFEEIGMPRTAADVDLWRECQRREIVLVTGNRNRRDETSLEATLQAFGTARSLPVFTLADPRRVPEERPYAGRVAVRLLQYLMEIDNIRGTGRLYLP